MWGRIRPDMLRSGPRVGQGCARIFFASARGLQTDTTLGAFPGHARGPLWARARARCGQTLGASTRGMHSGCAFKARNSLEPRIVGTLGARPRGRHPGRALKARTRRARTRGIHVACVRRSPPGPRLRNRERRLGAFSLTSEPCRAASSPESAAGVVYPECMLGVGARSGCAEWVPGVRAKLPLRIALCNFGQCPSKTRPGLAVFRLIVSILILGQLSYNIDS